MRILLPLLPTGLLLPASPEAAAGKAWAWVDQPAIPVGTSGTHSLQYQYNRLAEQRRSSLVAHRFTAYGDTHRRSAAVDDPV